MVVEETTVALEMKVAMEKVMGIEVVPEAVVMVWQGLGGKTLGTVLPNFLGTRQSLFINMSQKI